MKKIIFESKLSEGLSSITKKLLGALTSGKIKKIKTTDDKESTSLFAAIRGFEKASREIDTILAKNPDLSKKFQSFFK